VWLPKIKCKVGECSKLNKQKKDMCQLMMVKNTLLTMHDDELSYERSVNIFKENNFVVVF
jgi:hypothetical protein